MPGAITHLRIGNELSETFRYSGSFLIGCIAPDAGLVLDNGTYDPPKASTHFKAPSSVGGFTIGDWSFYREYVNNQSVHTPPETCDFRLGYFCHLLSDNLWLWCCSKQILKANLKHELADIEAYFLQCNPGLDFTLVAPFPISPDSEQILPYDRVWHKVGSVNHLLTTVSDKVNRPRVWCVAAEKQIDDFVVYAHDVYCAIIYELQNGVQPSAEHVSVLTMYESICSQLAERYFDGL